MKYEFYDIEYENNNCVLRALSKALDKNAKIIEDELKCIDNDYLDEYVFDKYLVNNNFIINSQANGKKLKSINYDGVNIVYGLKGDWYHMVCIIDNKIYDKHGYDDLKDLIVIKVYKKCSI